MRRSLPLGAPDRGGRGQARRRELRIRSRMGVQGHGCRAGADQRGAQLRVRTPRTAQLQGLRLFDVKLYNSNYHEFYIEDMASKRR